jgi:PAS domain S-box-containing protein
VRDAGGRLTHFVGVLSDVTEQMRVQDELRRSEGQYRIIAENTDDMIILTGLDGIRRYVSPASHDILGRAPEDLIGTKLGTSIHPDDRAAALADYGELLAGRQRASTASYRVRHQSGYWRHVEARRRLLLDTRGEPQALVSVIRDITQREQLEERLRQSQKMEAVGQLTGGVAHDFNNLLTVILGNAEVLVDDPSNPALTRNLAQIILDAAVKGSELTQHLLAFGRRQSLKPVRLSLDHVVKGMIPLLRRTLGEHIELETHFSHSLFAALTDRTLLESAILNLAVNAKDAMPQGGTLAITTGEGIAGPEQGVLPVGQDIVFVTVSDTGTGMSAEVLARVFEPFFTTKEVGRGSGLGLSMVYGFAQQSGGHVAIKSLEGEGTTVTILLPVIARASVDHGAEGERPAPLAGRERVLLVEDDPQVLQFVSSQLVSLGYEVTAGPDALELLRDGAPIDLLFTDVVLPKGMSGVELARRAKEIRPSLKVLMTSGYPEEAFQHHGRPEEGTLLLHKPFRRKQLAETLKRVLENA